MLIVFDIEDVIEAFNEPSQNSESIIILSDIKEGK